MRVITKVSEKEFLALVSKALGKNVVGIGYEPEDNSIFIHEDDDVVSGKLSDNEVVICSTR